MNHVLKPQKTKIRPKLIQAFDTEDDSKGTVKLINFFDGKKHHTFNSVEKSLYYLYDLEPPKNKYIYMFAHNVEYDIVNLFKNHWNLIDSIVWNNLCIFAKIKKKNIVFCDTMNLSYNASLKQIGEIIGIEKLETDFESIEYVQRDTEIVYRYVERLQELLNNEFKVNLKYTLPSVALEIWKTHFLKHEVERHLNHEVFESYFGGRTEAFYIGKWKGDINYCDVNSMYPHVMLNDYPDTGDVKECDGNPNFGYGKFRVKVDSEIPLLPVRLNNKVYFPNGIIDGVWTLHEVNELERTGTGEILKRFWVRGTDKGFPYFKDYANYFYKKKKDSKNEFDRNFYKLILNSLYGKFGEKRIGESFINIQDVRETDSIKKIFGNKAIVERGEITDSRVSNPLWSSYVTGYSRVNLWRNLCYVSDFADLFYCDTDSIIYSGRNDLLAISEKIGDWSLEKYTDMEIKGNKFYMLKNDTETVYKSKGIKKAEQSIFFDYHIAVFESPIKLRESLMIDGLTDDQKIKVQNYWTYIIKEIVSGYDKRLVLNDGFTKPFDIMEIEPAPKIKLPTAKENETLRSVILANGGLKYSQDIPKHFFQRYFYLFRKLGKKPDEMIDGLNRIGWNFNNIDDFYDKINQGWLSYNLNGFNLTLYI